MTPEERALREIARRTKLKRSLDPDKVLFGPQRDFAVSTAKLQAAVCSRRAGKSFGLAFKIIRAMIHHQGCTVAYVTQTREKAKHIIWPALRIICNAMGLIEGIDYRFREDNGEFRLVKSKSVMITCGTEDRRQLEKLRGPSYPLVVIDEAQAMPYFILKAIDDIIEPATMDYGADGQIVVTGTPNAAKAGPFYDITNGSKDIPLGTYEVHHWTWRDNHHLAKSHPGGRFGWVEDLKKRRKWHDKHPSYLREYEGQWVHDDDTVVYKINEALNVVEEWPEALVDDWVYHLGIDVGHKAPSAFVVTASSEDLRSMYAIHSHKLSGLLSSEVAVEVMKLQEEYDFSSIVIDTGGMGAPYADELKRKHGIAAEAAKKTKKAAHIEMINSDFQTGAIKIVRSGNQDLIDELTLLQWDELSLARNKPEEDKRTPNHLCDALLYSWRNQHYLMGEGVPEGPREGSEAWWAEEEARMEQATVEKLKKKNATGWWEEDYEEPNMDLWESDFGRNLL